MAEYGVKKKGVLDLFENSPHLSNQVIADSVGCTKSYVYSLIGSNRSQQNKKRLAQAFEQKKNQNGFIWRDLKKTRSDFVETFLPKKIYKGERVDDFSNYHLPTDDSYASTGSGEDLSGSWSQYEYLSERRIGVGPRITRVPAEDAVKEGFKFLDTKGKVVERPDIEQWLKDTDFLNELAQAIYYERVFGISFLLSYYSEDDKNKGILGTPVKKSEGTIVAFEAHSPNILSPINVFESQKLDKNPQEWDLVGGYYNPQMIHRSRVRVLMSRQKHDRWYGLSVWEPIWDSAIPYYQALIFLLRGFSKWGNTLVKYIIPSDEDIDTLYTKYGDIVEDMKMNGTLIAPEGSEVDFVPTQLATGLREMLDIWIEDMSAGTGIPVPLMMGRVVASGLGNNGYAIMENYYWGMIKKIQRAFTDDVAAILKAAGFDIEGLTIDWNLSVTKTDQQRLADELMEIEIQMAEKELEMMDLELDGKRLENEMMEYQHLGNMLGINQEAEEGEKPPPQKQTSDFWKYKEKLQARRLELEKRFFERGHNMGAIA